MFRAGPLRYSPNSDTGSTHLVDHLAVEKSVVEAGAAEGVLTARQLERRTRILETAIQLASEGGYDAVQMRDVAGQAGVALGTLYRYFSSKDQLLAAAWAHWAARLEPRISNR